LFAATNKLSQTTRNGFEELVFNWMQPFNSDWNHNGWRHNNFILGPIL